MSDVMKIEKYAIAVFANNEHPIVGHLPHLPGEFVGFITRGVFYKPVISRFFDVFEHPIQAEDYLHCEDGVLDTFPHGYTFKIVQFGFFEVGDWK